ncbi:MAG: PBP1A family penicillin-binding protein [Fibrobacteres bacterium]|nr:PBP1A family penicillin-binding protein [Fibrobacterota bacterium]
MARQQKKKFAFNRTVLIALAISVTILIIAVIAVNKIYDGLKPGMPSIAQLEKIEPNLITRVYSADDSLLMEFYTERRIWRSFNDIPPHVYNAVTSIEDKRYWKHWGMNIYAWPGIVAGYAVAGKKMRGGSTLTQQLARNIYASIGMDRSLIRKIKELFTAFQIERTYTKQDIMEFYINQVCMGGGAYGFQAAAQKFFGKNKLTDLTVAEAATLAAVIQRPEFYRPDIHPENALRRRNLVLMNMKQDGHITKDEYKKAIATPIKTVAAKDKKGKAPYFTEYVRQYLEKTYGAEGLYTGGYKVKTTVNYKGQKVAEAVADSLVNVFQQQADRRFIAIMGLTKRLGLPADTLLKDMPRYAAMIDTLFGNRYSKTEMEPDENGEMKPKLIKKGYPDSLRYRRVQVAFVALNNKTGAILSMIGGRDFDESKFNRAVQAYRQPGSAFKPFIYTVAIDQGIPPTEQILDQPFAIRDPVQGEWQPHNYDNEYRGFITLRKGLALSVNTVAIKLQQKVGTRAVVDLAARMGLDGKHMQEVPSLAIGSCEAIPIDLISAYSIFPNGGVRATPYAIDTIWDRNGTIVEAHRPISNSVLRPATARVMTSVLQAVVQSGTAFPAYAQGVNWPAGGKTGTTNNYTDTWFIGFDSEITSGAWIGFDEKRPLGEGRTGANTTLPLWIRYMLFAKDTIGAPRTDFAMPSGVSHRRICKRSYKAASSGCDTCYSEYFLSGTEPDTCTIHK